MNKIVSIIREMAITFLISLIIVFFVTQFVLIPAKIEGHSMEPNLRHQAYVLLGKITLFDGIDRFKIVAIDKDDENIIKRVIGLPNEKVEYINNKLYINNIEVKENFIINGNTQDFSIQLKEDEYFCLGDNREHSSDSRVYGPFSKSDIKSESVFLQIGGE